MKPAEITDYLSSLTWVKQEDGTYESNEFPFEPILAIALIDASDDDSFILLSRDGEKTGYIIMTSSQIAKFEAQGVVFKFPKEEQDLANPHLDMPNVPISFWNTPDITDFMNNQTWEQQPDGSYISGGFALPIILKGALLKYVGRKELSLITDKKGSEFHIQLTGQQMDGFKAQGMEFVLSELHQLTPVPVTVTTELIDFMNGLVWDKNPKGKYISHDFREPQSILKEALRKAYNAGELILHGSKTTRLFQIEMTTSGARKFAQLGVNFGSLIGEPSRPTRQL